MGQEQKQGPGGGEAAKADLGPRQSWLHPAGGGRMGCRVLSGQASLTEQELVHSVPTQKEVSPALSQTSAVVSQRVPEGAGASQSSLSCRGSCQGTVQVCRWGN